MYIDYAIYGATHGAEQEAITERAEQTARVMQAIREWRQRRRQRRARRRRDYTTAA